MLLSLTIQRCIAASFITLLLITPAHAQIRIDIDSNAAKDATGIITLDDLAVQDTAILHPDFCVRNNLLYLPGYTAPLNFANVPWEEHGIVMVIEKLAGNRIKGTFIDGHHAQMMAKGTDDGIIMPEDEYDREVIGIINSIFEGGDHVDTCDEIQRLNTLRTINFYSVESLNGYLMLSSLLTSVQNQQPQKKTGTFLPAYQ